MGNKPQHIAIVMDGNGRWASKKYLPRSMGHIKGLEVAKEVVKFCLDEQIPALSLFAFSTENWRRPLVEVNTLMDLLHKVFTEEVAEIHANQIKLQVIGDLTALPGQLQQLILDAMELTKENRKLQLNIAISYGGRWDLITAVKKIFTACNSGQLNIDDLNESVFAKYLSLGDVPDPDLLIRTSGEQRLSNFFLWQSAYTEFFFTEVLWPDFGIKDFKAALDFYAVTNRKFGKISMEQAKVCADVPINL